ncbi:MAG: nuclear transport factor 2 family protein [Gammaproteobacteria bacterium]|nr:nuclear transport factor 2 family protein [Gammaproteobacteria bacterium]
MTRLAWLHSLARVGRLPFNGEAPSSGRVEIAAMAQSFYDAFPDLVVEIDEIRSTASHAVYLWTLKGVHAETGNYVKVSGRENWRLGEDGLIADSVGNFDAQD